MQLGTLNLVQYFWKEDSVSNSLFSGKKSQKYEQIVTIAYNVKGCFTFDTFIFWISPNLAKYTYGLLPLWATSSNFLKTNRTKMMNFCYKIHWKKHVVYIQKNIFGEYFFSYERRWCFWEIFPPFFEKKSREIFLDLNLVSSSAIAPLRWLDIAKNTGKSLQSIQLCFKLLQYLFGFPY
jgi:hypothetical protein